MLLEQSQAPISLLLDLEETQFQQWRHSQLTAAFLQYLRDQAAAFKRDLLDRWQANNLTDADSHQTRGIVQTLEEMADLKLETIHRFYGKEEIT